WRILIIINPIWQLIWARVESKNQGLQSGHSSFCLAQCANPVSGPLPFLRVIKHGKDMWLPSLRGNVQTQRFEIYAVRNVVSSFAEACRDLREPLRNNYLPKW